MGKDVIQERDRCKDSTGCNQILSGVHGNIRYECREGNITDGPKRSFSTNKDTYFQDVFRECEDEEGNVSITELSTSLQENHGMFLSDHSVQSYVEKRKSSGWLYEPKLGVLKRQ
jgi:hypothetical protein